MRKNNSVILILFVGVVLTFLVIVLFNGCGSSQSPYPTSLYENNTDSTIPNRFGIVVHYKESNCEWYILYDKDTSAEYMMIVNNKNTQYETRTITPLYNADGDVLVYDETL